MTTFVQSAFVTLVFSISNFFINKNSKGRKLSAKKYLLSVIQLYPYTIRSPWSIQENLTVKMDSNLFNSFLHRTKTIQNEIINGKKQNIFTTLFCGTIYIELYPLLCISCFKLVYRPGYATAYTIR